MKFHLKALIIWFLVYYFLIDGGLYSFIVYGEFEEISFIDSAWSVTTPISFFLFWLISYYTFYKFYPSRKWMFIIIGILLSFILPIVFRYSLEQILSLKLLGATNYPSGTSFKRYALDQFSFGFRYVPFGVLFYFFYYILFRQDKEKELVIENQKMEMSLLRSQINPHFLLNSLNNIQSLVYMKSDKAITSIENLSDILKYKLYNDKKWISLNEELELVNSYMELEKLRYDYDVNVNVNSEPELSTELVPQFLLLPLIENAFNMPI